MIRSKTGITVAALACLATAACENLPGTKREQGAVIGGAGGAVAGAVIAKGNPVLGALLGGVLGAGGGYLLGVQMEHADNRNVAGAQASIQNAQSNPATAEQARAASTADANGDGFVTMDEVIAMQRAGFSDDEMLRRLRDTNQIFALSQSQKDYLVANGVSRNVVNQMDQINADKRSKYLNNNPTTPASDVIGKPQ